MGQKPKWLYRLEAGSPEKGLWYNEKNELVWKLSHKRPSYGL